jgi:very-short-patch-repair endonuclease
MRKYFSNKIVFKKFRKDLRNKSTSAEAALWKLIKNRPLEGRKFRRQHSLGKYIVDFYCSEEKLIIELDGDFHGEYFKIDEDKIRDENLKKLGYKTLRFENKVIFQDSEFVLNEIKNKFSR